MPLRDNLGREIDEREFERTWEDLIARFGAVSQEIGRIRGQWTHASKRYEDESIRYFIDCEDTRAARQFFMDFKDVLKDRFRQIDIWITKHTVEVI